MTEIAQRLEQIREEVARAAGKGGKEAVELIAVSKGHDAEKVREAMEAGQLLFGESKVQEARVKIPSLSSHARWHFIGHLQTNKVRVAIPLFELIHSIDSLELAAQVSQCAAVEGCFPRLLLQVNVAAEASKFGFSPDKLEQSMEALLELPRISIEGLMIIPPLARKAEESRPYFARIRALRDEMEKKFALRLPHLSMGMSGDFVVAIEEGATLVRVGTAIFGARSRKR